MTLRKLSDKVKGSALVSLLLGVIGIQALLCSCDNGCEQIREAFMTTTFTSTSGRSMSSIKLLCYSDTLGYSTTISSSYTDIELQLNPKATSTTMILDCTYSDYGDSYTQSDTVTINYTVEPKFLDMECGCTVLFHIDEVTSTRNLFGNFIINEANVVADGQVTNLIFEY